MSTDEPTSSWHDIMASRRNCKELWGLVLLSLSCLRSLVSFTFERLLQRLPTDCNSTDSWILKGGTVSEGNENWPTWWGKKTLIQLQYKVAQKKIKESWHRYNSRKRFKMLRMVPQILKVVKTLKEI